MPHQTHLSQAGSIVTHPRNTRSTYTWPDRLIWLALLLWIVLLVPAHAQAATPDARTCSAQVLQISAAQSSDGGSRPQSAQWQTVALPDNWMQRWPTYSGTAWYRIDWQAACPTSTGQNLALMVESIVMAGEVYVNDSLLWRDDSLVEPLSRSWNMPRYWLLPDQLLKADTNTLMIRVVGVAGQNPGLGPIHLGEAQSIRQMYDERLWHNRTLFMVNLTVSFVLGGIFFFIWLTNRKQTDYGWYALMSLFWVLFISNVLLTKPWPFTDTVSIAKANAIALVLYVACFCIFTWRFGEQHMPRLEKALWILSASLIVIVFVAPHHMLHHAIALGILLPACIFFINCLQFPFHALRTRKFEHIILACGLLVFFVVALYDLLAINHLIPGGKPLTPLSSLATMLCLSGVLGLRHARSVRRIESFNEELETGIEQARMDLTAILAREHELVLSNTRLQERLQISHDLHDGLGGSLVRMMAMVEQADTQLQNQQFLSLLKQIRDDLRQTIDSGSSSGVRIPATPSEWIAPVRHRFMQLFDDREINATWSLPLQWQTPPDALQCMALTRLVEEALINVVKHSRAQHVQLRLWQPESDLLVLKIEDDGVGFDVEAVRQAGISVGMRSMHARISALNGVLDVQSAPGRTVLTVRLHLASTTVNS